MSPSDKAVKKRVEEASEEHTFNQKSFPMRLTFKGVLIAEASSDWKYSRKNGPEELTQYRTSFLLYREGSKFYLVKRGESSNPQDIPYEDVYSFSEFTQLRDWILDPSFKQLKLSKPIIELLKEVPSNVEFLSDTEKVRWTECFIEGGYE